MVRNRCKTQERAPQPSARGYPAARAPSAQLSTPAGEHTCAPEVLQIVQAMLLGCDPYGRGPCPQLITEGAWGLGGKSQSHPGAKLRRKGAGERKAAPPPRCLPVLL